jgi:dienelactone hydrolase
MEVVRHFPWAAGPLVSALLALSMWGANPPADVRNVEVYTFKTHFRPRDYASRREWESRRSQLREQVLSAAGLLPAPEKTPLKPRVVRRFDYEGYSIEVVLLETLPGYFLGGDLYIPTARKESHPAVLIPHGHWDKGRLENLPTYSVPALGVNLARQGYVAFAYDMVGFNDTRQTSHSFSSPSRALWSFHPMGLQLWNSIRALDFLESLPYVDSHRLAMTGASGGATQTIFLTAVDDRIAVAAPVNMVSAYMQGGDPCEEAPNLRIGTSNVELAAVAAPRPMIVVSSTRDWTRHTPVEEFPAIRRIYSLYGKAEMVANVQIDAEHNYNGQSREAVYRFFAEHLHPSAPDFVERPFTLPPDQDLLAYNKGDLPPGTPGFDQVFQTWRLAARASVKRSSPAQLRDALRNVLCVEYPRTVDGLADGNRTLLTRPGRKDRVNGLWTPGNGDPVILVNPEGASAARTSHLGQELLKSGRPVLMIDLFTASEIRRRQSEYDDYFLSYNRTEQAERVQDILTALSYVKANAKGTPELIGVGRAGLATLFAGAIAPVRTSVIADLNGFAGWDEDFLTQFFVPGIQRVGGLNAALKLVAVTRVLVPATIPRPRTSPAQ